MRLKRLPVTKATMIKWILTTFYPFFSEEITLFNAVSENISSLIFKPAEFEEN